MKVLLDRKFEYILDGLDDVREYIVFEPEDGVTMICGEHGFINEYYRLPGLKYIQIASSGYNMLDLDYIKEHDIAVLNARGLYSVPISEYVVSYILSITKKHRMFDLSQSKQEWNPDRSLQSIEGKKALVLGAGDIGKHIAKRLNAFDVQVIGINTDGRDIEGFEHCDTLEHFESYLGDVDFVVSALPENDETVHLLNRKHFSMMKDGAIFVNVGRGSLIDYTDLEDSIDHLAGFVIDVFEVEPMPKDCFLWTIPNVYITGHASAGSQNNNRRTVELFTYNIRAVIMGNEVRNHVAL